MTSWQKLATFGKLDAAGREVLISVAAAGIYRKDKSSERLNAELGDASTTTAETVIALLWLHSQIQLSIKNLRIGKGWGGRRPVPRAVGELAGETLTDSQIKDVWFQIKNKK
jgi:hypothetical protein